MIPGRPRVAPSALLCGVLAVGAVLVAGATLDAVRQAERAHVHRMAAPAASGIAARIVSNEKLAHVPGKRATVEVVDFPPLASVPEHHHGGSVTVYVVSGTIRSQLDGGQIEDFGPEETFFEPPGTVHTLTANPSATEPARFVAIHVLDEGAALTTYH